VRRAGCMLTSSMRFEKLTWKIAFRKCICERACAEHRYWKSGFGPNGKIIDRTLARLLTLIIDNDRCNVPGAALQRRLTRKIWILLQSDGDGELINSDPRSWNFRAENEKRRCKCRPQWRTMPGIAITASTHAGDVDLGRWTSFSCTKAIYSAFTDKRPAGIPLERCINKRR